MLTVGDKFPDFNLKATVSTESLEKAFFPISNLGPVLEWVARLTPLWHGVSLSRMFCLDTVDWSLAALHVVVLTVLCVLGWWLAVRGLDKRLEV